MANTATPTHSGAANHISKVKFTKHVEPGQYKNGPDRHSSMHNVRKNTLAEMINDIEAIIANGKNPNIYESAGNSKNNILSLICYYDNTKDGAKKIEYLLNLKNPKTGEYYFSPFEPVQVYSDQGYSDSSGEKVFNSNGGLSQCVRISVYQALRDGRGDRFKDSALRKEKLDMLLSCWNSRVVEACDNNNMKELEKLLDVEMLKDFLTLPHFENSPITKTFVKIFSSNIVDLQSAFDAVNTLPEEAQINAITFLSQFDNINIAPDQMSLNGLESNSIGGNLE